MKEINNAIYTTDLRDIKEIPKAWKRGCELFDTTVAGHYRALDKELLFKFLDMAAELQDENGWIALYKDEAMPMDARVDMIYKPTYATAAIAIYTFDYYKDDFDSGKLSFLKKLLNTFDSGIRGHGFEAAGTLLETMEMLGNHSVINFIKNHPEISKPLADTLNEVLEDFKKVLSREEVSVYGFGRTPANSRIQKLVSYWDGKEIPVFVYGTLMKGKRAHHLLDGADFGGRFILKNCAMFDLGDFPGIKRRKDGSVLGEVYFVDNETLENLDRYEGEGTLYKRNLAQAKNKSLTVVCNAYFYLGDVDENTVVHGFWEPDDNDYVWYASYGSNLSEERFRCYIKGGICSSNGVRYNGCTDKSDWIDTQTRWINGRVYFGNSSRSWGGKGVAFFDENGKNRIPMKLYKITRDQFEDVKIQEGPSANWYGRTVFLGLDDDGCEIYTLTSEELRPVNEPAPEYTELILNALRKELGYTKSDALAYIKSCGADVTIFENKK